MVLIKVQGPTVVSKWYSNNSLMLNKKKSVFIPFALSSQNLPDQTIIQFHNNKYKNTNIINECNNNCYCISRVSSYNYLSVIFDEKLKWKPHIDMLILRLRKCFYIFKELRSILDIPCLKMIYFALVQSVLMYGIIVWGSAYKNVLEPLNIAHRTLVKVITKNIFNSEINTNNIFQKLKILSLEQCYTIKIKF